MRSEWFYKNFVWCFLILVGVAAITVATVQTIRVNDMQQVVLQRSAQLNAQNKAIVEGAKIAVATQNQEVMQASTPPPEEAPSSGSE